MAIGRDQPEAVARFYHHTEAGDEEALNRSIPGATFDWIADDGPSFKARFRHLLLDGIVLTTLGLDQASYVTLGRRQPDFNIWHAIGPFGAANGGEARQGDMVVVRPGEGATLRTLAPTSIQSFALQPSLFAQAGELELPDALLTAPGAGRWRIASQEASLGFLASHRTIMAQLDAHPVLLDRPATRAALHNALLGMIGTLGDAGRFEPDRSTTGRHTKIMQRFEQIARDVGDEPLSLLDMCRLTGTSRRSLAAIVLMRTGKPPGEYLRWRRLWRARALLSQPEESTTVTEVAFRLGFWHLGRFAAAYGAAFGERPSRTLVRATGAQERSNLSTSAQTG
jgi:AraC-like DNA-binding protein